MRCCPLEQYLLPHRWVGRQVAECGHRRLVGGSTRGKSDIERTRVSGNYKQSARPIVVARFAHENLVVSLRYVDRPRSVADIYTVHVHLGETGSGVDHQCPVGRWGTGHNFKAGEIPRAIGLRYDPQHVRLHLLAERVRITRHECE